MSDKVYVPSAAITAGALVEIGVCPRHGEVGARSKDRTFYARTPIWIYVICVLSLFLGFILHVVTRKKVTGPIPECAICLRQQSARRRNTVIAWLAVLGLVFLSAALNLTALSIVAFLAVIAALVYSVLAKDLQSGVVTKDRQWVELREVAPAFSARVQDIAMPADAVATRPG